MPKPPELVAEEINSPAVQPCALFHLARTTLSEKYWPNPGFSKIFARSASDIGEVFGCKAIAVAALVRASAG